ncbi:hypothetical protein IQ260_26835 [Leptolyngbya cf. ectocarpi LEGE 11479]|uniref:Uncharacterized protein n=1 Tax=Leptolyngbya cf. ectocarpi LEGE 11479 TaxID=1828722 RepID=A0A928ZZJ1_LEPEC|nr:hypothetical protein [Leptolyngbya ectocarpi]MBE9070263.1 hypothetical protein [Leptolyngbya cf. ectocarpi LEGE 11479]
MSPFNHPLPNDLQRQIRAERKFNLSEAIGREGGSFLKGSQAMVPRPLRALAAINGSIDQHLVDPHGALQPCLKRWVKTDGRIGKYLDEPLTALQVIVLDIMENPPILYEFARQVAVECGQMNGERPYFQKPGTEASPDAAYSHKSIQGILAELLHGVTSASNPF